MENSQETCSSRMQWKTTIFLDEWHEHSGDFILYSPLWMGACLPQGWPGSPPIPAWGRHLSERGYLGGKIGLLEWLSWYSDSLS